jgi:hypothetical protein
MEKEASDSGFPATLAAVAAFKDRKEALPLVALALREPSTHVRREALRFLLASKGTAAADLVIQGFSHLDPEERAQVLNDRERLLTEVAPFFRDSAPRGRVELAGFANALPPEESLGLLLPLLEDPIEEVRRIALEALLRVVEEQKSGRLKLSEPSALRSFLAAVELALAKASEEEALALVEGLIRAAGESAEARANLRRIVSGQTGAQAAVLRAIEGSAEPALAPVLLGLVAGGPASGRERASAILRSRKEPEFLRALAREAAARMESPAGIPALAVMALSQVAWEELPPADLSALPVVAQRRLLLIVRSFRGDSETRAGRLAGFLRSRDRRIRELALESLRPYPPSLFEKGLLSLLDDPAEELQLRAIELLARVPTAECRRRLMEKARRSSDRVRKLIFGRLLLPRSAGETVIGSRARGVGPGKPFEEYAFPAIRLPGPSRERAVR